MSLYNIRYLAPIAILIGLFPLISTAEEPAAEPTAEIMEPEIDHEILEAPIEQKSGSSKIISSSLTEYVQENNKNAPSENSANKGENGTWITNLANKVAEKSSETFGAQTTIAPVHRSNASVFDISGVMLRMNRQQAAEALSKRGYRKTAENLDIPNFIRWRYEEICRNEGVVGYERIQSCIITMSKKKNYQYTQKESYTNFQTKENIDIFYTSNFTGNKVYRIMYNTEAANIKGSGPKADYLRNIKIFDFWKKISQKYGSPDNKERVTWGLGENKPILQAATGQLMLSDPMLLQLDYMRMSREDQKFMNTAVYTF